LRILGRAPEAEVIEEGIQGAIDSSVELVKGSASRFRQHGVVSDRLEDGCGERRVDALGELQE
jgi:hypothetical protein